MHDNQSFCGQTGASPVAGGYPATGYGLLHRPALMQRSPPSVWPSVPPGTVVRSFELSFNEWHVLAISQAICLYREAQGINGPLFVGLNTHALSTPAGASALEVLAANGVHVMLAEGDEYTPTRRFPTPSSATTVAVPAGWRTASSLRRPTTRRKVVVNQYNPPNGGPADTHVTSG